MLNNTICLFTAILGFFTLTLIALRNRTNQNINLFILAFFFLSNLRYLAHGLIDFPPIYNRQKAFDVLLIANAWPLLYLYFLKLMVNDLYPKRKLLVHLLLPNLIFILYCFKGYFTQLDQEIGFKIGTLIVSLINLIYTVASYKLLSKNVWKRSSDISIINDRNSGIKKWTSLLFGLFLVLHLFFLIYMLFNFTPEGHFFYDEFLCKTSFLWIILYGVILYNPELLYGFDIFHQKIQTYKSQRFIFDNIWDFSFSSLINKQDTQLQEKIGTQIKNYIVEIEHHALNSNLFFDADFKISTLASKLVIPKSHLQFVFKYHCKISFADFKKIIRIQKSIELIEEGYLKSNTLESLASLTGFSSYSSFFKSFKSIEGISPLEYMKR
jgi:AraC-like DNA-binding protein